nr:tRNA 2-thiouridine(34) synthase MnmA [Pseudomonadota bacterium]
MEAINSEKNQPSESQRVVVAMSGGVDSCASALLLADQGYSVIGVAMQVWDYQKNGGSSSRATCCAPSDFDDAREIATSRNFPFYVFDFEDSFYDAVIKPFVNSYIAGKTPNPCLDCNRKVKFFQLRERAKSFGADKVATGHYAQIKEKSDGSFGLFTSKDLMKDQSYFLYALNQDDLKTTLFPVGAMTKPEVREILSKNGFEIASKAESQDICFVSTSVSEFVEKESGIAAKKGLIKDEAGNSLGEHQGVYNYTVGQRRGLGVSAKNPLYVLNIDETENQITVGPKDSLERDFFYINEVNWIAGNIPNSPINARVKLRYRHPGVE